MIMPIRKHWKMVSIYSVSHFLVDFSCAFIMFRIVAGRADGHIALLLYNFCAFALQMPIGLIADRVNRNYLFAIAGLFLAVLAYVPLDSSIAIAIISGIGNAMFHIGGGIDILNISDRKLGALGVFVSPGAFGIYYGTILGRGAAFPAAVIAPVLAAAAVLIFILHTKQKDTFPQNASLSLEGFGAKSIILPCVCLFLVVCLRSFVGMTLNFSWKSVGAWGTVLTAAVVLGKTLGGLAADRFGVFKTALLSLSIAAVLFLFPQFPLAGVAAMLLFNMTMPITLWALAKIMPGAKGFSFGILTFGLFLGFLPSYLGIDISIIAFWIFPLIAAISLILLLAGLKGAKL